MAQEDAIVFVVDDDASVRASLSSLIRSVGLRVETFATAQEFLEHPPADGPACLVLDVLLPGSSGLDLPAALSTLRAPVPVIFITGHGTIPMSVRAMKAGAMEFLTKPFSDEALLAAVQQALDRDRLARRERGELALLRQRYQKLTAREREVLALVVTGRLNKQIAAELGAAEQTIKVHRGRIMQKLEVGSVAELVHLIERITGQPWGPAAADPNRTLIR